MTADQLAALAALGLTPEQLVGVVRIFEAKDAERRTRERDRKRQWRDRNALSRDVPGHDGTGTGHDGTLSPPCSPSPSPSAPTLSSPPIIPLSHDPSAAPRPARAKKPVDWSQFDAFWSVYPRKVDKKRARQTWEREVQRGTDPPTIVAMARRYATEMEGNEPQFVKHPSTWLNAVEFVATPERRPGDPIIPVSQMTPEQRAFYDHIESLKHKNGAHPS